MNRDQLLSRIDKLEGQVQLFGEHRKENIELRKEKVTLQKLVKQVSEDASDWKIAFHSQRRSNEADFKENLKWLYALEDITEVTKGLSSGLKMRRIAERAIQG